MARIKYGYLYGPTTGRWVPVAASLKVHPAGGMFVFLDASGHVTLNLDASAGIKGWACFPSCFRPGTTDETNGYWTSGAAGVDKVYVYTSPYAVFLMPCTSGTAWAQARYGEPCDITGVATADGTPQEANPGTTSTDVLVVEMSHATHTATDVIAVRMNPAKIQLDT